MIGEKILLATPLLRWYLEHGLEVSFRYCKLVKFLYKVFQQIILFFWVTHIYQIIGYSPKSCFKSFGDAVSDARRAGEADPSKAIIADTMKLKGNSSYGKTITNKE
jgi:hypothetical protein